MERAVKWNFALDLSRETDHHDKTCAQKQSLTKRNCGAINNEEQRKTFGMFEQTSRKRARDDVNNENQENFDYDFENLRRKSDDANSGHSRANSVDQENCETFENLYRKRKRHDSASKINHSRNHANSDDHNQDTSNYDHDEMERKRLLANCQERARMHKINEALDELRKHLPQQFNLYHRRLSKIRTLRLAMSYISELAELIRADDIRRYQEYRGAVISNMAARVEVCAAGPVVGLAVGGTGAEAPVQQTGTPTALLDLPTTAVPTPYYPYLREACSGHTVAVESMYRTPDQQQHHDATAAIYNPRQLNFGGGAIQNQLQTTPHQPKSHLQPTTHPETITIGILAENDGNNSTPVKARITKQLFKAEGITTPESMRGGLRFDTFASPFLGIRYTAELNSSLASAGSVYEGIGGEEGVGEQEDRGLEPGQIPTTPGRPCRTLVDLIDEDD